MTQKTSRGRAADPVAVSADQGEARWWFGGLAVLKATAADTGGQMTMAEMTEPPGAEGRCTFHHRENEAFWVLEDDVTFEVGDATFEAHAGDYAFGPRDIPHATRSATPAAACSSLHPRSLRGPGERDERARRQPHAASPPKGPPDMERIAAFVEARGCELLACASFSTWKRCSRGWIEDVRRLRAAAGLGEDRVRVVTRAAPN